jgi:hypothetical protein
MNFQFLAIGAVVIFLAGLGAGWKYEHGRFMDFKQAVAVEAAKQEAKVESITKQQDLVNKGIKNDYESKLAAVRNYYSSGVRNPSSSSMSGVSPAPKGTDAETAYPILAGQCAATTVQLTSLQDWVNAQVGIK